MENSQQVEQALQNFTKQLLISTSEANKTGNQIIVWLLIALSLCSVSGWIMAAISLLWLTSLK